MNTYHILARKYRPQSFADMMVGQDPVIKTLTNAFKSGRIAQAYILSGMRGVGKTTTARIIARSLNYKTVDIDVPTVEFKGLGDHCESILHGNHIDVVELDAASHTGIDDVREIIEQMCYRPISARYKVYIIDEVHMLSTAAFNGLLKTLEEPPPNVKFIFATTEIRKVPITVLSRCQRFDFHRISIEDLIGLFEKIMHKESIEYDSEAISMIARASDGSVRDGLSLLDQAIARGDGRVEVPSVRLMLSLADRNQIIDLFGYLIKGDIVSALRAFSVQYESGVNPSVVLHDLADFTHLVTRIKYLPEMVNSSLYSESENLRAFEYAKEVPITFLSRLWQMILKGISEIEGFPRPVEAVEMVLIRLAHASQLPSPEGIARYIIKDKQKKNLNNLEPSASPSAKAPAGYNSSQGSIPSQGLSYSSNDETIKKKTSHIGFNASRSDTQDYKKELIVLCDDHCDGTMKDLLQNFITVSSFKKGQIEVYLRNNAPNGLLKKLAIKLKNWTRENWEIKSNTGFCFDNFLADDDIQAVRSVFPKAKIVCVRTI